jgi:transposase
MLTMEDWVTIRNLKKRNPKLGSREIAKLMGISRNTVRSALRSEGGPQYDRQVKVNGDIAPFREYIYEKIFVKKLRGSYVLESIQSKGYKGSQSAFYRYLAKLRAVAKRTYKPYETGPGEQAQFDWSPYTVMITGRLVKIYIYCYILSFSRYRIYNVSLSDTQGSVFEAFENSSVKN